MALTTDEQELLDKYPSSHLNQRLLLGILKRIASARLRCPTNKELHQEYDVMNASPRVKALALAGLIRIEVYGRNWRVIQITSTGDRTQEYKDGMTPPYLIIDQMGSRRMV